jgi:hypothetical protein
MPARLLVPLATLAALVAVALREPTPAGIAEGIFLAMLATAALAAVAVLAPAPAWELGLGAALAAAIGWGFPAGPGRGAAMMLLLTATLAIAVVRRLSGSLPGSLPDLPFGVALPLAVGAQVLLRSELLFEPPSRRTLVALLALPVVGALAMTRLARRHGGDRALIAAGAVLVLAPGWNVASTLGLAAVAAGDAVLDRELGRRWRAGAALVLLALVLTLGAILLRTPSLAALAAPVALAALFLPRAGVRWARIGIGALLAVTALLAAYPWKRAEPVVAALALPFHLPGAGQILLPLDSSVSLDAAHPVWEAPLPRTTTDSVVLESSLSNGAGLANGTPVATIRLGDQAETVHAGEDTGEWAARRADVANSRLRSPEGWITWIAGDFLGQRYRARRDFAAPVRASRIRIERRSDLPADVAVSIHQVEVRSGFLPLAVGDPFLGTLLLLPFMLAAFWWIGREAVRQGAEPLSPRSTAGEITALAVLVLLALARPHLALGYADETIAAGFLLVLASRVLRQVRALRPLLGERLPQRPSVLFFFLPLVVYLALLPWTSGHRQPDGDEPYNLLITHSLAYDFDADLTNNYAAGDWRHFMARPIAPQPGDPVGPHGEIYSRHNELLPLVLAPAYRLAGKTGALAVMAAMAAALAWLVLRLARHDFAGRPGETLAVWALIAFGPPLLLYSVQVWVEIPGALLAALALDRTLELEGQGPRAWNRGDWLAIGLPILLLPLLKIRFLLVTGPLLAMAWWYTGRPRKPLLVLGGLLVALAGGILLYNRLLYHNPLKIHSWDEVDPYRYPLSAYVKGVLGLFWDGAFGLFACAPVWLILLPAILLGIARRSRVLLQVSVLLLPYLVIVAPRVEWYGGWSPPFRYALIALPLLGLALVPLLAERLGPGARALLAGLGALTLVLTLAWTIVPGWTYNFADGRNHPLDRLDERFGEDLARFFPSSVRMRTASWLWPPLSLALVTLVWWLPGRKRTRGAWAENAGLAGIAVLLAAAAALPAAAARLPTRVIEFEDPQVHKSGGHLHPDLWTIERARYRGGWVLRVGERLEAPVVPDGGRVRITLHAQLIRNQPVPFRVDVRAGDRLLGVWMPVRTRAWETVRFGPLDWPAGAPLVLNADGPHPPGALNGAILDRLDLDWKP